VGEPARILPKPQRRRHTAAEVQKIRRLLLVRLKQRITTRSTNPTELVQSVLYLGTEALGYVCISGYHDELVAHHLGFRRAGGDQFDHWTSKTWELRDDMDGARHLSAVLAPRGTGKTVWTTVLAVWYAVRSRNVRVLITSKTERSALRQGRVIRLLLRRPIMAAMFGELKGDLWDGHGFNIAGRTRAEGASSFTMLGSGSQVEGVHFDVIFADDVVTLANSRTPGMRENLWAWFWQTLTPTCRPISDVLGRGRIHASGTRYHAQDMHQRLQDETEGWAGAYQRFPALRPSAAWLERHRQQVLDWTHACTEAVSEGREPPPAPEPVPEELEGGVWGENPDNWESIAPEFLPVDVLLEMRQDMPRPFFDAQYQVDARLLKGRLFKSEWIQWTPETAAMRGLPGCSGMDLGLSLDEAADYTALVHVKIDRNWEHPETGQRGRLLVWDATVERLSLDGKVRLLKSDHRMNRPRAQAVEKVQAQGLLLENPELASLPVEGVRPQGDKLLRASLLLTYFQAGRMFFVERSGARGPRIQEHLQQTVYQLLDFQGDGSGHDDAVDALAYAVEVLAQRWRQAADAGRKQEPKQDPEAENPLGLRANYGSRSRR
jgi:predicted phage terminase large subunit-like protein